MNARFWVWINDGPVKLCLSPKRPRLQWERWYRHEEGWTSEGERWSLVSGGVEREYGTDGTDCDGRLSTGGRLFCPFGQLRSRDSELKECDGIMLPNWDEVPGSYGQRDYSAEAMGY